MKNNGLQGYVQAEDLLQKGLSPTTDEIWLQSQCQRIAEFFKDMN